MFSSQHLSILYIEDDMHFREKNAAFLRENGMRVFTANTTDRGYELFKVHDIAVIVINLPLPNENGLDFIIHLRQLDIHIPIVITTTEADKKILIDAINLDISRHLIKSYKTTELLDTLKRISHKLPSAQTSVLSDLSNGYTYNYDTKSVIQPDGSSVVLTKKEYLFIELLLNSKSKILTYEMLENTLWPQSSMSMDSLRTLVRSIRKKTYPEIIINHNGTGYLSNI
ncbi:MAG: response regulator [Sulfurimonas sp.]|nr:response regulator [Sulfurimonas sp.]MDD3059835.1 response regulator [Sulfurimonas sp.]MDD5202171.1 response regulator [Sulfurimonas sp.]